MSTANLETAFANHVAIIMDGNGRWANNRLLPRYSGHLAGVKAVERTLKAAVQNNIKYLTLFAFSSENVNRSNSEIAFLKKIFFNNLSERIDELHSNEIKVNFIGDLTYFGEQLQKQMQYAIDITKNNNKLVLTIALNYGGRWDIVQACNKILSHYFKTKDPTNIDNLVSNNPTITEKDFAGYLSTYDLPELDLLIRTSGEQRVSNFLLWQLAYSEIYFTNKYWPDFTEEDFKQALNFFSSRQRRFGAAADLMVSTEH